MTTWIRIKVEVENEDGDIVRVDTVKKVFNSQMLEVFQESDLGETIKEMFTHMKTQIENLALAKSRFVFDQVLFLDINFHKLKLTGGSSYAPLPDWILSKKTIVNPQNEEDEARMFQVALHHENINLHSERMSNLRRFEGNYNWRGLQFPVALDKINVFE